MPGVEKLGLQRVRQILSGNSRETITALIAKDKALEPEANSITAVDKLVRSHRDLYRLLNNFVSFQDFTGAGKKPCFRSARFIWTSEVANSACRVDDAAPNTRRWPDWRRRFLAYCDLTRKSTGEKMTIAAGFHQR